jgi:hypothetical protein
VARESLIALVALAIGGALVFGALKLAGWRSPSDVRVAMSTAAAAVVSDAPEPVSDVGQAPDSPQLAPLTLTRNNLVGPGVLRGVAL